MKKYTTVMGIDPGLSGGVAIIRDGDPIVEKMGSTEMDIHIIISNMLAVGEAYRTKCYIEKVHSMPGQGVASSFKFGMNYGLLRGLLIANKIPFEEVTPRVWQKGLGIVPRKKNESKTQFKNRLKGLAQQLFPNIEMTLAKCDALLIAEYGRRLELGIINK